MRPLVALLGAISAIGAAAVTAACNGPFSNEDLLFLKAIPTRAQVAIAVPGSSAGDPTTSRTSTEAAPKPTGVTAQYYNSARQVSDALNHATFFVLDIVAEIAKHEPTIREDDKRVWGPFPSDNNLELRLTIARVRTSTVFKTTSTSTAVEVDHFFDYALEGRAQGIDPWLTLFAGRYAESESLDNGMGAIFLNLEAGRQLAMNDDAGLYLIGYDTRFNQQTIEVAIDSEVDPDQPFADVEGGYRYNEEPSGNKAFVFAVKENIPELKPDTQPELLIISARWLPDFRGRADVVATQGDLGSFAFWVSECWDSDFMQTFLLSNYPELAPAGTLEGCAPELRMSAFGR